MDSAVQAGVETQIGAGMVQEQPTVSAREIGIDALLEFRQELERYGAAHERCRHAAAGGEQDLRGLLHNAERTLTASAERFARIELVSDGVLKRLQRS
jgi:hypothetical protein